MHFVKFTAISVLAFALAAVAAPVDNGSNAAAAANVKQQTNNVSEDNEQVYLAKLKHATLIDGILADLPIVGPILGGPNSILTPILGTAVEIIDNVVAEIASVIDPLI
ncbi:hypothetical protein H4219_000433 [Mycoemilia scoparia]|uniref:Uncharacterized protein n=1 Tax=Mycoemilia scoparia TaxID=417184 RepID=A0A9W8DT09_9FUNG|nr:hypothetical protein H4219_000433 [Mycoemilia scoparia]